MFTSFFASKFLNGNGLCLRPVEYLNLIKANEQTRE